MGIQCLGLVLERDGSPSSTMHTIQSYSQLTKTCFGSGTMLFCLRTPRSNPHFLTIIPIFAYRRTSLGSHCCTDVTPRSRYGFKPGTEAVSASNGMYVDLRNSRSCNCTNIHPSRGSQCDFLCHLLSEKIPPMRVLNTLSAFICRILGKYF
jgi:hypothetical protein